MWVCCTENSIYQKRNTEYKGERERDENVHGGSINSPTAQLHAIFTEIWQRCLAHGTLWLWFASKLTPFLGDVCRRLVDSLLLPFFPKSFPINLSQVIFVFLYFFCLVLLTPTPFFGFSRPNIGVFCLENVLPSSPSSPTLHVAALR